MEGIRFYLEFPTRSAKKRSGREHKGHLGNVVSLWDGHEGLAGVFDYPNSPVATTGISQSFLDQCKRIPERLAREIHPRLFKRLDVP